MGHEVKAYWFNSSKILSLMRKRLEALDEKINCFKKALRP